METKIKSKKVWIKPGVISLNIRKDTFGGSGSGPEGASRWGPPGPPSGGGTFGNRKS